DVDWPRRRRIKAAECRVGDQIGQLYEVGFARCSRDRIIQDEPSGTCQATSAKHASSSPGSTRLPLQPTNQMRLTFIMDHKHLGITERCEALKPLIEVFPRDLARIQRRLASS